MNRDMAKTIIDMLDRDEWDVNYCTAVHRDTKLVLWIANGRFACGIYGGCSNDMPPFGMRGKFWRAVERMKHRTLIGQRCDAQEGKALRVFDREMHV